MSAPRLASALRRVTVLLVLLGGLAVAGCGGGDDAGSAGSSPAASGVVGVAETKALLDGIPQKRLVLGEPSAPVTIVEIIDLQCPFCRKHALETQPRVIKELVRTGRAQLHLLPISFLGADSQRMEIVMLRLAARDRAWDFASLVFRNQEQEGSGYATDAWLRSIVSAIPGTDPADAASLASTTPDELIAQTAQTTQAIAQATARRVGGGGTPFFSVGATGAPLDELVPVLSGAPPGAYERLLKAVQDVEAGKRPEPFSIPRGGAAAEPKSATGA